MEFIRNLLSKQSPKEVAKDRLQLILIHDRADVSPEFLDTIKGEILKVLTNYADIDNKDVEVRITKTTAEDGSPALVASIPIKNMKKKAKE